MGAWGHQNFENDDALDFVSDFRERPSESLLLESLGLVVDAGEEGEYIEASEAGAALAAAELVAASLGNPSAALPADLGNLLAELRTGENTDLRKMARKAVKHILKESELQALWAEGGEPNEWQAVQRELLARLKPAG